MSDRDDPVYLKVPVPGSATLALGSIRIDRLSREVVGPGGSRLIAPLVLDVLTLLTDRRGDVVTRDELFALCWDGVHVGDDSLNRVISEIRRIERTIGAGSFAVTTIQGTGYRLDLTGDESNGAELPAAANPGTAPAPPVPTRRWMIAGALALPMAGAGVWWATRVQGDPRAAALIQQALMMDGSGLPDSEMRGAAMLEEAVEIEPRNAQAWGLLALVRTWMTEFVPPAGVADITLAARDAARRALAIDPDQVDAAAALAILPPSFGDWQNSERRMAAVLRDHPGHLPTRDALNFLRVATGQTQAPSRDRIAMVAAHPLHVGYQYRLVYAHWMLGDIGAADRTAERARSLWPKHVALWFAHIWVMAFTGRADRALNEVNNAATRPELPPWLLELTQASLSAMISRRPADRDKSVRLIIASVAKSPSATIFGLLMLNGLDEIDRAFDLAKAYLLETGPLMAAVRWREGTMPMNDERRRKTHMLFTPVAAAMRTDPRFDRLMQDIGLAAYWEQAEVTPDYKQQVV